MSSTDPSTDRTEVPQQVTMVITREAVQSFMTQPTAVAHR